MRAPLKSPDSVYNSTAYPLSRGLVFVNGATLGFIALFIAVGLGLYPMLAVLPGLQEALRWAGIAFLL